MAWSIGIGNAHRLPECSRRLVGHLLLEITLTQVISGGEIGGIQLQRALKNRNRLIKLAGSGVCQSQMKSRKRVVGAELHNFTKLLYRWLIVAHAVIIQPQQVVNSYGIELCFESSIQLLGRLRILTVLAVGNGI